MSDGTIAGVTTALSPIATPAKTPATGSTAKARAVPMPCEARPTAKKAQASRQNFADKLEQEQDEDAADHALMSPSSGVAVNGERGRRRRT